MRRGRRTGVSGIGIRSPRSHPVPWQNNQTLFTCSRSQIAPHSWSHPLFASIQSSRRLSLVDSASNSCLRTPHTPPRSESRCHAPDMDIVRVVPSLRRKRMFAQIESPNAPYCVLTIASPYAVATRATLPSPKSSCSFCIADHTSPRVASP